MFPPTFPPAPPIAGDDGAGVIMDIGDAVDIGDAIALGDFVGLGVFIACGFILLCFMPVAIGDGLGDGAASAACDRASAMPAVSSRRFIGW